MYRFLNQWKCRLRANESDCARLAEAAAIAAPLLEDLRAERLIDMDFSATRTSAIARSFDTLLSGLSKQSHTCAAKVLHMYNRSLFVMWDSSIRGGYAVAGDGDSYARVFLPRVQQLAREAVASAVAEGLAGRSEAATYIESRCSDKPLAKIMDEYNYCRFTMKDADFWSPFASLPAGAPS